MQLVPVAQPAASRLVTDRPVADRDELQRAMSAHVGIGRDAGGLAAVAALVAAAPQRAVRTAADAEDAALTLVAGALLVAASARHESRGCHIRTEYPLARPEWCRSTTVVLDAGGTPVLAEPVTVDGVA